MKLLYINLKKGILDYIESTYHVRADVTFDINSKEQLESYLGKMYSFDQVLKVDGIEARYNDEIRYVQCKVKNTNSKTSEYFVLFYKDIPVVELISNVSKKSIQQLISPISVDDSEIREFSKFIEVSKYVFKISDKVYQAQSYTNEDKGSKLYEKFVSDSNIVDIIYDCNNPIAVSVDGKREQIDPKEVSVNFKQELMGYTRNGDFSSKVKKL